MRFQIITLFPEVVGPYLGASMLWKAAEKEIASYEVINLREFGLGPRRQVDDMPYGGGDGMLLRCEPIFAAVEQAKESAPDARVILPTPRGKLWTQQLAKEFSGRHEDADYIIICPHYEGYDERILELVDHQISLGNYILTGGELPALIIVDSIVRLLPGVLGGENSAEDESFSCGTNLEYPQYTRPEEFRGQKVPPVLLSGHHGEIAKWRQDHSGQI